jgi:hydrogenase/urease accessory protein HupE
MMKGGTTQISLRMVTVLLIMLLGFSTNGFSHELQPSLLEIRQLSNDQFDISWKAPTYFKKNHPAKLQLPATWKTIGEATVRNLSDSKLHRRIVQVPQGDITGSTIRFINLESTITDVFVRVYWLDKTTTSSIARPNQPWVEIEGPKTSWQIFKDYLVLGVDHILSGFDHLTFVLALLLIVVGWRKLLVTVTSFTLAHSITLVAVTLGFLWVPGPPVEAVIALSILFLAGELIKVNRGGDSLTAKYPWVIAFVFGLLHGFGFAGALNDIGLPENEVLLSLLSFNIGVELGQLLFVAGVLIVISILKKVSIFWPTWSYQLPAYAIGSVSAFWLIQRVSLF